VTTGKVIEVDLSKQWLVAYEDGEVVYDAPVATGKDGFNTPTGTYDIYNKLPLRTMRGELNGESWTVPNVPNVMYINGMVALHGTYWHNKFGTGVRMSHGCVNLSLADAAWLYAWAPVGTTVTIHH
jgi:lipoprotein-anchoring transpeptidase ErfK/SrfK